MYIYIYLDRFALDPYHSACFCANYHAFHVFFPRKCRVQIARVFYAKQAFSDDVRCWWLLVSKMMVLAWVVRGLGGMITFLVAIATKDDIWETWWCSLFMAKTGDGVGMGGWGGWGGWWRALLIATKDDIWVWSSETKSKPANDTTNDFKSVGTVDYSIKPGPNQTTHVELSVQDCRQTDTHHERSNGSKSNKTNPQNQDEQGIIF